MHGKQLVGYKLLHTRLAYRHVDRTRVFYNYRVVQKKYHWRQDSFVVNSNFCELPCILKRNVKILILKYQNFNTSYKNH